MSTTLLPLTASAYTPHELHTDTLVWAETNCYVDVWIELLHSLGMQPLASAAFSLASDFEGDQWTFFKFPQEDLYAAYGIDVHEMNPWRGSLVHCVEQLQLGRLLTIEADSYYLPDTQGVSYGIEHVKSTIIPNAVDLAGRRLGYFHNAGYFELAGDDFDGVFGVGTHLPADGVLPPYVELIRLDGLVDRRATELTDISFDLLRRHLSRTPHDNPVERMSDRIRADAEWIKAEPTNTFHQWAFATVRQCGANAGLAAEYCRWLGSRREGKPGLLEAAECWSELATTAKSVQFLMARLSRGRTVSLDEPLAAMAGYWASAQRATSALAL
ncbi:hypothetical protein BJ986_001875 [Phycicoccus badiiscoriae]|uniref:DUF1839 family protein n=1 Tax=Pedococcus badiiscoriae TaxID=642776 RepID=A0A852WED5_9MICO|nr:DUF1839 family protein [Pedococcus badiiscoriae]NYG07388.1 hypothetical protein [Pedococcus badiiscoriae]